MIRWGCWPALLTLSLACVGCAGDKAATQASEIRATAGARLDARQEAVSMQPGTNAPSIPASRPALASARKTDEMTPSPYLATESTFIEQDGISADTSEEILLNNVIFSQVLERMRSDEMTSMEAQALARHHRGVLERAVGTQGVVEDLTCGLSLCMGSVTARSEADHTAWSVRLVKDPAARRYGAIHQFEPVGGGIQNRFVFSADPAISALIMSR